MHVQVILLFRPCSGKAAAIGEAPHTVRKPLTERAAQDLPTALAAAASAVREEGEETALTCLLFHRFEHKAAAADANEMWRQGRVTCGDEGQGDGGKAREATKAPPRTADSGGGWRRSLGDGRQRAE